MSTPTIRTFAVGTSLLIVLAIGAANIALAQDPGTPLPGTLGFVMIFDENGHATINGQPSPVLAGAGAGVIYVLPGPVVIGDVQVLTSGDISPTNPSGLSDILRFVQAGPTGGALQYLSLLDDNSPPDLADVAGLPPFPTPFTVPETGPEGSNGFLWSATDPTTGVTALYQGISDTPEPSTFILGGLGLIVLFLIGRRQRALKKV